MTRPLRNGALFLLCLAACKKGDKVPAYIDLSAFSVATDPLSEGSDRSNIPQAWSYVNDDPLGVWEALARVPVLRSGTVQMKFIAGVERNGVSTDLVQYPFYRTWIGNVELTPGTHTPVHPIFQYQPDLNFWIADFEDPAIPFTFDVASDTVMIQWDSSLHPDDVEPGEGDAAAFFLDTDHPRMKAICFETADLEGTGTTWLEMDYRSDHRMVVGLYYRLNGVVVDEPFLFIAPTALSGGGMPWKKIHIDLSPFTNNLLASDRKFYIAGELGAGETNANFWIDNVKLVRP
ncbi:MAG: hypothetical protein ABI599_06385 [Flavobacteriales bacterium]